MKLQGDAMVFSATGPLGSLRAALGGGGMTLESLGGVSISGSASNLSNAVALTATGHGGGVTLSALGYGASSASPAANLTVRHTATGGVVSSTAGEVALTATERATLAGKSVACNAATAVDLAGLRGTLRVGAPAASASVANAGGLRMTASDAPLEASTTGLAGSVTVSAQDARVEVSSAQPVADAVRVKATVGGISLSSGGSSGIALTTTAAPITLAAVGGASSISNAANDDGDHLTIALTGTHAAELNINSDGTTGDAIVLNAKNANGGVRVEAGTAGTGAVQVNSGIGGITLGTSGQGKLSGTNGVSLRSSGNSVTAEAGYVQSGAPPPIKLTLDKDGKLTVSATGDSVVGVTGADLSLTVAGGATHGLRATSTGSVAVEAAGAGAEAVKLAATSSNGGVTVTASGVTGVVDAVATGVNGKVSARASGSNGEVELQGGTNGRVYVSIGLTKKLVVLPGGIGVGRQDASYPIHMASGAYVTVGGTWTDASSRALKTNVSALELRDAAAVLKRLTPVGFRYKASPNHPTLGFIAEDVPDPVAQEGRAGLSALPLTAVLTRVVQGQDERIARLEAALLALEQRCAGGGQADISPGNKPVTTLSQL